MINNKNNRILQYLDEIEQPKQKNLDGVFSDNQVYPQSPWGLSSMVSLKMTMEHERPSRIIRKIPFKSLDKNDMSPEEQEYLRQYEKRFLRTLDQDDMPTNGLMDDLGLS